MRWYTSYMFRDTDSEYFHISEIEQISHAPFKDEDGLADALAHPYDQSLHLWVKIDCTIHTLLLKDEHNAASVGIRHDEFSTYNAMPTEERIARRIIDLWGSIKFPEHIDLYTTTKEIGDF